MVHITGKIFHAPKSEGLLVCSVISSVGSRSCARLRLRQELQALLQAGGVTRTVLGQLAPDFDGFVDRRERARVIPGLTQSNGQLV
jgi:hypothetical protein